MGRIISKDHNKRIINLFLKRESSIISDHHWRTLSQKLKVLAALYLLWAGLVLGVSFIATPIKFQAPHLTFSVALEVGKVTFHFFNKIEWGLLICAAFLTLRALANRQSWWLFTFLALLILSQTFWLLPELDGRIDRVMAGAPPTPGYLHWTYIVLEGLKLFLLLIGPKVITRPFGWKKTKFVV